MEDDWSEDIKKQYERARTAARLTYGPWQVMKVGNAVVAAGPPNDYKRTAVGYAVADVGGNVIAVVEHRAVAELLSQIPDMCDPALRPTISMPFLSTETWHEAAGQAPNLAGVVEPERVWSHGLETGYTLGFESGYSEGAEEIDHPLNHSVDAEGTPDAG